MRHEREQTTPARTGAYLALAVACCLLLLGSVLSPTCALASPSSEAEPTSRAQHTPAVEISAEGSAARIEGGDLALADFSRMEKGSNRPIDGVYRGYCYVMDSSQESLCAVDMTSYVVVYVPEAIAQRYALSLDDAQTQNELRSLICALDSYSAQGNAKIDDDADWFFTSETIFTYQGVTISFSQEYQPGYWYTSIIKADGTDVTKQDHTQDARVTALRPSHVDYATLQDAKTTTIAEAPSAFDTLGSFFEDLDWSPLWVTLKTTGTALIFIFILGLLAAWWTLRLSPRMQSVVDAVLTIPLVLPPTVCGFLLLLCLGRNTPIGSWFDQVGFPLVFSWQATVIAAFVVAFPLMYRSARGAFEAIDADMLDAARTLGWGESRIFFRLMLPLAWSSIAAGTMLAFARALGEFGATLFLAGNYAGITRTIPIAIYFEWMGGNIDVALFWTIVVLVISFVMIFALNLWSRKTTRYRRKEVDA